MDQSYYLPLLVLISLATAVITLLATPKSRQAVAGPLAFVLSLIPLVGVISLVFRFPNLASGTDKAWHFNFVAVWFRPIGLRVEMGIDSISLWLLVLTAVLTPISILASFNYIKERQRDCRSRATQERPSSHVFSGEIRHRFCLP